MAITIYQNVHMHETKILVYIPAGGGSKFSVGSASLDPTLVIPMRQEREAVEAARLAFFINEICCLND